MPSATSCVRRFLRIIVCSVVLGLFYGCAQTAEQLAEGAAAGGTEETLAELNQPESRQILNELLTMPGIANFGELLSRGIARGLVRALGEEVRPEQVEAFVEAVIDGVEPRLVGLLEGDFIQGQLAGLRGGIEDLSGSVIRAALGEALDPQTRRQLSVLADQLTRTIVRAALQVFSEQLRQDLGPALRELISDEIGAGLAGAIREHVGPALTETLREDELRQALADSAYTMGKHSVLGANAGFREIQQKTPEDAAGPIEAVQQVISEGEQTLQTVLWMLGISVLVLLLIVIVLGVGLWRAMARGGEMIEESKVREESLSEMAHAVSAAEEKSD